jgi:hypothetical protein
VTSFWPDRYKQKRNRTDLYLVALSPHGCLHLSDLFTRVCCVYSSLGRSILIKNKEIACSRSGIKHLLSGIELWQQSLPVKLGPFFVCHRALPVTSHPALLLRPLYCSNATTHRLRCRLATKLYSGTISGGFAAMPCCHSRPACSSAVFSRVHPRFLPQHVFADFAAMGCCCVMQSSVAAQFCGDFLPCHHGRCVEYFSFSFNTEST